MLTREQYACFAERGFVRIPAAFSAAEAAAMEDRVWRWLERKYGFSRIDPAARVGAVPGLLPNGPARTVPTAIWHTDFGFLGPSDRTFGALVFSFLSDVPPGSGGTTVVAGSHRLIRKFVEGRSRASLGKMKIVRRSFLGSDPWLKALSSDAPDPERTDRLMSEGAIIDEVPVRVAELSEEAGDVVIGHPWLLHAPAPNGGSRPRITRVLRVHLAHQASLGEGW